MSDHKAVAQGSDHKRVPGDIDKNPIIVGHEFCGNILQVGKKWKDKFVPGHKYSIQPAIVFPGRESDAPGYSFHFCGGQATKVIIPREVLEMDCLLNYSGDGYFKASLSEPVSCIIGAFKTNYHNKPGEYSHKSGIVAGGCSLIMAGAGPMGLEAIDYAVHGPTKPRLLVITDIDQTRLNRAAQLFSPERAASCGVKLVYVNTGSGDPIATLKALTDGKGFDDVFVFAPVAPLIEQASKLLGYNGCLNFFAGPSKPEFSSSINFYDVHYMGHHVVGSSGGNTDDMRDALDLMSKGLMNPACMITHIGGIDCAAKTTIDLPGIPGSKKLIYTNLSMPLTALDDFERQGQTDPIFKELGRIIAKTDGLWSAEAETHLLKHARPIGRG
jgi:threonine dehydrogenase-like Zn-dependent dehydrogenase